MRRQFTVSNLADYAFNKIKVSPSRLDAYLECQYPEIELTGRMNTL